MRNQYTLSKKEMELNKRKNELTLFELGSIYEEKLIEEMKQAEEVYKELPEPVRLEQWFSIYSEDLERRARKSQKKARFRRYSPRIAAVILAFAITMTALTFGVEAFRLRVLNLFVDSDEDHMLVEYEYSADTIEYPDDWYDYYFPAYIPEDYTLLDASGDECNKTVVLIDPTERFLVWTQSRGEIGMSIDNEDILKEEVPINETLGLMMEKDGVIFLTWTESDRVFVLEGYEDIETLIKMAESIILKKD